jgi:signal transduction histidine kinase
MDALIQDLLDVARVGGGTLGLRRTEHPVGALVAEAVETLRPLVAAHDLEFAVAGADDDVVACVDGDRVIQVVSNLVGNAVKFTPAGGRVALDYAVVGGELRISVADTGTGIAAEQLPHVFGAFWQARHADRRGLGLGLAIARGIVEAHGGSIWVESTLGRGTTFVFSLPLGDSCTLD